MKCEKAFEQQNRYFEITDGGETFSDDVVGLIVKPVHNHQSGDNFLIVKGNGVGWPYSEGRTMYLFTPNLRPLNKKDQRKIELEVIHGAAKTRRQTSRQETVLAQ